MCILCTCSMSVPRKLTLLTAPARINISVGGDQPSWRAPPIVTLAVEVGPSSYRTNIHMLRRHFASAHAEWPLKRGEHGCLLRPAPAAAGACCGGLVGGLAGGLPAPALALAQHDEACLERCAAETNLYEDVLQEAEGFIPHTLVRIPHGERALFFRVLAADAAARTLRLRMERYTLFWQQQDVELVRSFLPVYISEFSSRSMA